MLNIYIRKIGERERERMKVMPDFGRKGNSKDWSETNGRQVEIEQFYVMAKLGLRE